MLKITLELFNEAINTLEEQYAKDRLFGQTLNICFPENYAENLMPNNSLLTNMLLKMLQHLTNDYTETNLSWIEYYCFELNFGAKYKPGSVTDYDINVDLSTPTALYNFLLKNDSIRQIKENIKPEAYVSE